MSKNEKNKEQEKNDGSVAPSGQAEDDAGTKTEETTKEEQPEKESADLKKQLEEYKDKYLRLYAEFDNYKKRTAKERIEWIKTAGMEVILAMLPVLDDFERALKQLESINIPEVQSIKEGKLLIYNKLKSQLEQRGLKAMETKGKEFNPELHDAISEINASSEDMKGKVVDEVERGYYLNDVIIRHAKVVVGK